jgi:flagellar hook protein FlgE
MALLNSFNSGVSAVKTFSKSLEVIGDNIANVNTTGFKGSRVTNQDSFSETLNRSAPANGDIPGANTMQIGQGTSVASVSQRFTQGVLSTTGGPADLGISGKGFFKVQDPENQNFYYTRAGDFRLDDTGNLLTNDGMNVMMGGGPVVIPPAQGANPLQSYKIDKNGEIAAYYANGTAATTIGQIFLTSFANPNALERISGNLLTNPGGEAGGVGAAGATEATAANATLFGDIIQGTLELSNVD